jgi:cysteinyl-tRNA synthetase
MEAFGVSDAIRDNLAAAGIEVRDTPEGVEWSVIDRPVGDGR